MRSRFVVSPLCRGDYRIWACRAVKRLLERLHGCTVRTPIPAVVRYRARMDYLEEKLADVRIALSSDPEIARALRPQPLGPGRWAIVMDDSSRARLRDALEDLGWEPDELDLPMFEAHGREEHPVAPPQVGSRRR